MADRGNRLYGARTKWNRADKLESAQTIRAMNASKRGNRTRV